MNKKIAYLMRDFCFFVAVTCSNHVDTFCLRGELEYTESSYCLSVEDYDGDGCWIVSKVHKVSSATSPFFLPLHLSSLPLSLSFSLFLSFARYLGLSSRNPTARGFIFLACARECFSLMWKTTRTNRTERNFPPVALCLNKPTF